MQLEARIRKARLYDGVYYDSIRMGVLREEWMYQHISQPTNVQKRGATMSVIGLLGTTHNEGFRERYHYPLSLLRELILEFEPDIICGEVLPENWVAYQTKDAEVGYVGESEYNEVISPLVQDTGIRFEPIDWYEEDVWQDPFDLYPDDKESLEKQLDDWDEKIRATWNRGHIPFNSPEYDRLAKEKYDWLYQLNPDVQNVQWVCRNQIMAQRVRNVIRNNPGKRTLCVVGADYNYMLRELLQSESWQLVYPVR